MHIFFANSLSFDINFKITTFKCMPHRFFISKLLHEYHLLFFDFRLDFVIGLKIKFDVCHRNVQKVLDFQNKAPKKCPLSLLYKYIFRLNCLQSSAQGWNFVNKVYIGMSTSWILLRNYTAIWAKINADAPASRINKKKSSPEKCIFFLPIRFHLTLILKLQRPNACPILLLSRNSCINTDCFFSTLD